ncbi:hypothetical protein K437DRAFT_273337 [Tilletiaria anomala UBC 951]|uniref:Uncharacterized protein n=1 Tax=Tilletiaria anomala (strain ATCC 24038 / CBS 436.72 / UBC 951) TaxID=1037660 RepID=A0A066WDN9_TILAU|nr:uncharacterized protein K437DRAFT_273337 [Tilletiaria anomala UBC 951]KDN48855.1 hypothetical protein K437DRAFT_273337 [Tilletiaria anomala UBC 951]
MAFCAARRGASISRQCSLCQDAADSATVWRSMAHTGPSVRQRALTRVIHGLPYSTAISGSWLQPPAFESGTSPFERVASWSHRSISSAGSNTSNMDLDPRGVDHQLFEEPSEDYRHLLASLPNAASQAVVENPNSLPVSSQILAQILGDESLSRPVRLDKAANILADLVKLGTRVPEHIVFAHAARAAAEDISRLTEEISDWRTSEQARNRLQQVLVWIALSPTASQAALKGEREDVATAIQRATLKVIEATESPLHFERRLLAQFIILLAHKGWLSESFSGRLLAQTFTLSMPTSKRDSDGYAAWIMWCDSVLEQCRKAYTGAPLPACLQNDAESILISTSPTANEADNTLFFSLISQRFDVVLSYWRQRLLFGGRSGITQDLMDFGFGELKQPMECQLRAESWAQPVIGVNDPTCLKRHASDSEGYYTLRALVNGKDSEQLQRIYLRWTTTLRTAIKAGTAAQESEARCHGQEGLRVDQWIEWNHLLDIEQAPSFKASPLLTPEAYLNSARGQGVGFDIFLANWTRLHREAPTSKKAQDSLQVDCNIRAERPRGPMSLRERACMVLQDMLSLDVPPAEKEWSMIFNAFISEGHQAIPEIYALGAALEVLSPIPTKPMTDPTLQAALERFQPCIRATLSTRISALQACLHVRSDKGGRLLEQAHMIFRELWQCIVVNEHLDKQSEEARDEALNDFWAYVQHANRRISKKPFREAWQGVASDKITRLTIFQRLRAMRVLKSYINITMQHASHKGYLDLSRSESDAVHASQKG